MVNGSLGGVLFLLQPAIQKNLESIKKYDIEWKQLHDQLAVSVEAYSKAISSNAKYTEQLRLFTECQQLSAKIRKVSQEKHILTKDGSELANKHFEQITKIRANLAESINEATTLEIPVRKRANKRGARKKEIQAEIAHNEITEVLNLDITEKLKHEPLYCTCRKTSYGEMIECENNKCPEQWFHLRCVGLEVAPPESAVWYCDACRGHF
uniref:PHD-type domain-containing protein n=1 Tax=Rhabditophanes sp. KR3021 TaxID=114890 RepID=A0AC35UHH2_9BILA